MPVRMDTGVKYSKNEARDQSPVLMGEVKFKSVYERYNGLLKLCSISDKRMNQHGTMLE